MFMTEQQLRAMTLPQNVVATSRFTPLSHAQALDAIEHSLNRSGLEIARNDDGQEVKRFNVVRQGAQMVATLPLVNRIDQNSRMIVGIMNSHDKSLSLRVGFGSEVFVCANGCFFAERVIGRKHTTNILRDLPGLMMEAMSEVGLWSEQQAKLFERLRSTPLNDAEVHDVIIRSAVDHDCITGGEVVQVTDEWRNPRYEEFEPRNAWSLHNAFTEVGKRIQKQNGRSHAGRMVRLSGFFADEFAGDLKLKATRDVTQVIVDDEPVLVN